MANNSSSALITLSDGSNATPVPLSLPVVPGGVASLGGAVWLLAKGQPLVIVRNARTGEVMTKIDLLEEGVAIASVGTRVWVATVSNKMYIFSNEGTLLGALQAAGLPLVRHFFVISPDLVFTTGGGKDFAKWDTAQFSIERTFFGRTPGETLTGIVPANRGMTSILAASTASLRLYVLDGTCLAEIQEGASALCVVGTCGAAMGPASGRASSTALSSSAPTTTHSTDNSAVVWAAQAGWITVFTIDDVTKAAHFVRDKTIPCAGVKEMLHTAPHRVTTLDTEGLLTVWNVLECSPIRTFKTTGVIGVSSAASSFSKIAAETNCVSVWTVGDGKALIWTEEYTAAEAVGGDQQQYMKDLQRDEVQFLRKKLLYMESIGQLFRKKVTDLITNKANIQPAQTHRAFSEVDALYERALEAWRKEHDIHEPLPDIGAFGGGGGGDKHRSGHDPAMGAADREAGGDFTEYWKHKYHESQAELNAMKDEYENMVALLHNQQSSPHELEVKRAHHICQLIKEKNELRERERQLTEDVGKLRAKLREYNSPLASSGPVEDVELIKEQNYELRTEVGRLRSEIETIKQSTSEAQSSAKHNQILKQRVKKLRVDLDQAQLQLSKSTISAQNDVERLVETVAMLQNQVEDQKVSISTAERDKSATAVECVQKQAHIDKLKAEIEVLERELQQREAVDKAAQAEVRNEITMLCQSLDDRDQRLAELQSALNASKSALRDKTCEAAASRAELESKVAELDVQLSRVAHLEAVVADRKQYARTIGELQGRMEMVVEELRRSFTPVQFSDNIGQLEQRVSNLFALESQLRQKDDIIALRDDQIHQLQQHALKVQQQIQQVSSVFLHLPKSVEEVELLMVEVDEYRRRLGMDAETQEMIQIRLLELQAKRKAGEPVPVLLDLGKDKKPGASAAELERLKQMSDAMMAVASSAAKEDKTGLVQTPANTGASSDKASPAKDAGGKGPASNNAATPASTAAARRGTVTGQPPATSATTKASPGPASTASKTAAASPSAAKASAAAPAKAAATPAKSAATTPASSAASKAPANTAASKLTPGGKR